MRDYTHIDQYLDELLSDIYSQLMDDEHYAKMKAYIEKYIRPLKIDTVLDVGCGQGEANALFSELGVKYTGVTLGVDVEIAKCVGIQVYESDFSFLPFPDNSFDLVFSRHSVEHSPMPLLTLMEWHRVAKTWLGLVAPNPLYWTEVGRNHYSVLTKPQISWLLRRAGWVIKKFTSTETELQFLCRKRPRMGYEGWATIPLENEIRSWELRVTR